MKIPRTTSDPYVVEAVLRALDVLEVFDGSCELSLNEISGRTGLNKSRCFRLLHTLALRKYVERTGGGQGYRLGSRPFDRAVGSRRDVREAAHPYLVRLRDEFNETVNLGVIHNGEILYVDLVESQRPFRMSAMVGSRMPAGSTAMGRAILAHMTKEAAQEFMEKVSARRALHAELERVRQKGHAIDNEENEPGVACIGTAILDANGLPAAAVSMSGPVHRILVREQEIARALQKICRRVSEQMGFNGSRNSMVRTTDRGTKAASRIAAV
jgi:DNA-binding IclR family transcriptional regulator